MVSVIRSSLVILTAAGIIGALFPQTADAHPLHTTITEIVEDGAHGTVRATVRVFMDDLATMVKKTTNGRVSPASAAEWDLASQAYIRSAFGLRDKSGRDLPLKSCGVRRTGDLFWYCFEAAVPAAALLQVHANVLCDLYDDQVNVVQATVGGSRHSLLFTKGDKFKPLT